ncbi:MAG: transglycosylase SLT domain-containing protein [Anaerolineae bacterium]
MLLIIALLLAGLPLRSALADDALSAYWPDTISRWSDLIIQYSNNNGLDPNLVAAIIEEESKGDPRRVSPAGAVGLMQIMSYEAGFSWRPKAARLKIPEVNLEWGTNTLGEVIRQAQGRLSLALLAYNSGWDRIRLKATRLFATKVIDHYARSIISNEGFDPETLHDYTVYIVARSSARPSFVDRVDSNGQFEALRNFDPATLTDDLPHAVAYATIDERHVGWWVEVYIETADLRR